MAGQTLQLNDTMGCTFVGVVFAVAFYGCSCAQSLYYFREYPKDKLFLKSLVAFLWLLDTSRTVMDIAFTWYWLVTNHANVGGLAILPSTFAAEFFLASFTVFSVQCYFILTIWKLLQERWFKLPLTSLAVALSALSFAGGIVTVYRITTDTVTTAAVIDATVPASIQTVSAFVTDVYITIALCWTLWGQKTGFKRTENLISTLTTYAIHRGIFTGMVQLAHFATYISTIHTDTLYWMLWHVPGSKIYVNSLLAVLNVRHRLRDWTEDDTHISVEVFPLETISQAITSQSQTRSRGLARGTSSHTRIMLTKEIIRDDGVDITEQTREDDDLSRKPSPW